MRLLCLSLLLSLSMSVSATQPGTVRSQIDQQPNAICQDCDNDPPPDDGGGTPTPTPTQSAKILNHRVDPAAKTVEISFDNGMVVVIDETLGKMFVSNAGASTEMALDDAYLQLANGNAQAAAAYKAEIHSLLLDQSNLLQFSRQQSTSSGLIAETGSRKKGKSHHIGDGSSLMSDGGYAAFNCYWDPYYCNYQPMHVDFGGGSGGWYGFGYIDRRESPWSDYQEWLRWRNAACSAAQDNFEDAGLATAFMAGGCAAAGTGVGLAVCGVSGLAVIVFMNRAAENSAACAAPYPG